MTKVLITITFICILMLAYQQSEHVGITREMSERIVAQQEEIRELKVSYKACWFYAQQNCDMIGLLLAHTGCEVPLSSND